MKLEVNAKSVTIVFNGPAHAVADEIAGDVARAIKTHQAVARKKARHGSGEGSR